MRRVLVRNLAVLVLVALCVLIGYSTRSEAAQPYLTVSAATHYGPGSGKATGVDFTICNNRTFPAPHNDAGGSRDIGHVVTQVRGGKAFDLTSFDIADSLDGGQNCVTLLVLTKADTSLDATITWPRRSGSGSASASASGGVLGIGSAASETRQRDNDAQAPAQLDAVPVLRQPIVASAVPDAPEVLRPAVHVETTPTPDPQNPLKQREYIDYLNTHPQPAPSTSAAPVALPQTPGTGGGLPLLAIIAAFAAAAVVIASVLLYRRTASLPQGRHRAAPPPERPIYAPRHAFVYA